MAITPHLAPCLVVLRAQFNSLNRERDKASDGWIADGNHSATSDHQPDGRGVVHALDVDASGPWPGGLTMAGMVDEIVQSHRDGGDNRLTYVIHNGTIWSATRGWQPRGYDGPNPHDKHAHFSCARTVTAERDVSAFTIREESTMTTPAQNWAHDVDPSAGTYSAGGALWTVLGRTGLLNTLSAQTQGIVEALEDQGTDLDALGASLAVIASGLNQLLADPADVGEAHPLVAAYRYVQTNPVPSA